MAITNHERVGKSAELLRARLAPFVEREFVNIHKDKALTEARRLLPADDRMNGSRPITQWDAAVLLKVMWDAWNDVFGRTLGRADRSLVQELRDVRNHWAHQEAFLPRLADPSVLLGTVRDGLALLTWEQDSFGYADAYDPAATLCRGLRAGQNVAIPDQDARPRLSTERPKMCSETGN